MPNAAAAAVAVGVPLLFLYLVASLDLYASPDRRAVAYGAAWGALAFAVAGAANRAALAALPLAVVVVAVAPIVEELAKAVILVERERRPDFTYFVDGAVLGFATGTGFAMVENLSYLGGAPSGAGFGLSVNRAFSTSLMHGTACALVGIAIGRWRFGRGRGRVVGLAGGLAAAMALHVAFNHWVSGGDPRQVVYGAVGIGVAGVTAVATLILHGLREERRRLYATLARERAVTAAESRAVQALRQARALLDPVGERFGAARAAEVTRLLQLQARLGLTRQAALAAPDGPQRAALAAQVEALRRDVAAGQRALGLYVMAYVRAVWPDPDDTLWQRLDAAVAGGDGGADNLWTSLDDRAAAVEAAPRP